LSGQPFMPLFFGDLLAATPTWDGEERAVYVLLLAYQWTAGPLPNDVKRLAKMCQYDAKRFAALWQTVGPKFSLCGDGLLNERLEQHREKSAKLSEKNSNSGRRGAQGKWGGLTPRDAAATRAERMAAARLRGTHSQQEWELLRDICGPQCLRCGSQAALVKDHIIPVYQGGSDGIDNIQPLCKPCNSSKGPDRTDHRPNHWRASLAKLLAPTTGTTSGNPSHPIPSHSSTPSGFRTTRAELSESFETFLAETYPHSAHGSNHVTALHSAMGIVGSGRATEDDLRRRLTGFRAFVDTKGYSGPDKVPASHSWFAINRPSPYWAREWAAVPTKAEVQQDANIAAGLAFLNRDRSRSLA
jgi:uncharacterized protein YdaU (DUF1376 family)